MVLRFRPIVVTTVAAIFGIMPIAIWFGAGSELRQLLGVAVVGGLVVSQLLTLFTIPVTYIYMDGLSYWIGGRCRQRAGGIPHDHAVVPHYRDASE